MSWFLVGGAAIGAGVGSYGHDNWGWSKDAIWQGAAVGGAGGYMVGAGSSTAVATTSGTGGIQGAATTGSQWASTAPPLWGGVTSTSSGGIMATLTKPLIPGIASSNPLMLGAAGLALAGAPSSQGSSFQDNY